MKWEGRNSSGGGGGGGYDWKRVSETKSSGSELPTIRFKIRGRRGCVESEEEFSDALKSSKKQWGISSDEDMEKTSSIDLGVI